MRPPLPDGPYLVVGLARSGAAAASDAAAPHGRVLGDRQRRAARGARRGRGVVRRRRPRAARRGGLRGQEPGRAARGAGDRRGAGAGDPGARRAGAGLAAAGRNRFVAVTGTNGKTTTTELLGAMHRAAGVPVAVAGNVGTPLSSLVGALDPAATVVCECSSFQLEDATAFAPDCGLLLNLSEDHLDRHGTVEAYREAKLRMFAHQTAEQVAVAPPAAASPGPATGSGATSSRSASRLARHAGARRRRDPPARRAQPRERDGRRPPPRSPRGLPAEAVAEALRDVRRRAAPAGGGRHASTACSTSTTRRPPTSTPPCAGSRPSTAACTRSSAAASRAAASPACATAVAAHCRAAYLIGAAADRLAADLEGTVPLHRCGDLETARRSRRQRPRRPATWCCSRRPARATTSTATTSSAATISARSFLLHDFAHRRRRTPGWRKRGKGRKAPVKRPIEYSILYTATLCLLAFGAVMVYSASSAESLLDGSGRPRLLPQALPDLRRHRPGRDARRSRARA